MIKVDQKVAITGGTYYKEPPTGKVAGYGIIKINDTIKEVCIVQLDRAWENKDGMAVITHLTIGPGHLTPID